MSDLACKPLTDHLAERRDSGLVDIKFYVHNATGASPAKLFAEAEAVFEAIDNGAIEQLELTDRHTHTA